MPGKDLGHANPGLANMMQITSRLAGQALGVCLGVLALVGCADYLPTASGELSGTISASPLSWTEISQQEIIQLETQAADPYSVNLWIIGEGERLYIFAGDSYTTWVEHIDANPEVRVKIGESIYLLSAARVTNAEEFEWFAQAWEKKYGNRPRNENVAETYLMRLDNRSD
jgi:hypothetical protein